MAHQEDGGKNVFGERRKQNGYHQRTGTGTAEKRSSSRERLQMFEGVVIKRQGGGIRETFTVRRIASGVGVERTWPLHSPRIDRIEVVRRGIVRRAKLFYLRDKVGKAAKVKEVLR